MSRRRERAKKAERVAFFERAAWRRGDRFGRIEDVAIYRGQIADGVRKLIADLKARGEAFTPAYSKEVAAIVDGVLKTNHRIVRLTGKIIHGSHVMERIDDIGACKACCHAFVGDQVADELLAPCVPVSPYDRAWAKLLMDLKERVFKECQIQATGGSVEVSDYDHGADYGARIGVRANTDPSRYLEMSISKAQGERVLNLDAFGVRFLRRFMHEWRKMDEQAMMPIRSHIDGSLDILIDLGLEKTPGGETDEEFKRRVIEQIEIGSERVGREPSRADELRDIVADRNLASFIRASAADADDLALADEVERGGHHKCEACGKIVDRVTRFVDRMLGPCCLHVGIDLASK